VSPPVLFLDIDGVLNHRGTRERDPETGCTGIDPRNVAHLNAIFAAVPDLRLVISSSWRLMMSLGAISRALRAAGFRYPERIEGATPAFVESRGSLLVAQERGHEVQAWLDGQASPPRAIAILDDAEDMVHLTPRLVRTDMWDCGLKAEHAAAVVALLQETA
jgi:hypothetical protein